jgi:hypothetical protein
MHFKIRQIFAIAITFKLLILLFVAGLYTVKPLYDNQISGKPNPILYAFYLQDGNNYQAICTDGYQKKHVFESKDSLQYMAFLPGLPLLLCSVNWFPASFDMVWYGGILVNILLWFILVFALKYFVDGYYRSYNQKYYIILFFLVFPTSFFFHLNYTETLFIPLSLFIWRMVDEGKIKQSSLLGFLLGFVRITAIPFGFLMWIKYTINTYNQNSTKPISDIFGNKKYITESLTFAMYGFGALLTFAYFKYEFGNFNLFFESQKLFYGRESSIFSLFKTLKDVSGLTSNNYVYWDSFDFSREVFHFGFHFYDKTFRQISYYTLPFVFAILASLLLWKKNRKFELFYCWVMLILPMMSDSNSLNRYILQSFPFLLVVAEASFDNRYLRFPVLILSALSFLLFFTLHILGFWVA